MALELQDPPRSAHEAGIAGIDALDIPIAHAKGRLSRVREGLWPKLTALALFFGAWQLIPWRSLMAGELIVIIAEEPSLGVRLQCARELSDAPALMAAMLGILILGIGRRRGLGRA